MAEKESSLGRLRRDHPVFFWGTVTVLLVLLVAATAVAIRVPRYQREAALMAQRMDQQERATRDRILEARTQRTELAVALMRREMRLKSMEEKGVHLAISVDDSTLSLRHGAATLREVPVAIGPDSTIRGPNGQTWRFVRALGERYVADKLARPSEPIPEWVYVSRGQPVPPEEERTIEGGLGTYVLRLDDGTEIYTRPGKGPLAAGVKPAAFMIEKDRDLQAIFDAIREETPVYIY